MAYQHGVYTREQATSMSAATNSTAGLQVVFGTAPIYQPDRRYRAQTVQQLCRSGRSTRL